MNFGAVVDMGSFGGLSMDRWAFELKEGWLGLMARLGIGRYGML